MPTNTTIQPMNDAEVAAVSGGVIGGGVITTPMSTASLSTISGGPSAMLPGQSGGHFASGRFGWAAQTGSLLHMHYSISQDLFFSVMRR